MLKGLKELFPKSYIAIGVGDWAKPLLENNPYIDEVISCNAPWHNKQNCKFPANSIKTFILGLLYVLFSKESRYISSKKFTHGIDYLGSRQGSWLLLRARISPNRFGVKGYAGGENLCTKTIDFDLNSKVSNTGLSFLRLFDKDFISNINPTLSLQKAEIDWAENEWNQKRID